MGDTVHDGPWRGAENSPMATPSRRPSCSARPVRVLTDRPLRASVTFISISPLRGGATKWMFSERRVRSGSPDSASMARTVHAARKPPSGATGPHQRDPSRAW